MTVLEQNIIKKKAYNEALRYINNAKETLKKAKKEGKFYQDEKYVRTASGTAYLAVLIALDCILLLKNIPKPKQDRDGNRPDINFYLSNITNIDKKLKTLFVSAYKTLHLAGYYDGNPKVEIIQSGLDDAMDIFNKIKPAHKN
jgi:hypothetical protein